MCMKYMFIICGLVLMGCNTGSTTNKGAEKETNAAGREDTEVSAALQHPEGSGNWEKLEMVAFKDNKGMVVAEAPYPSSWKIMQTGNPGDAAITGPNGVKVVNFPAKSFMYTNDQRLQQVYYQSGQQLTPWPGVDQLIEDYIKPQAESQGLKFIKYYEIPEVTKIDKWYSDALYKAVPSETDALAIGTDWQTADGTPYFLLIHINVSNTTQMQNWYYFASGLQAEKAFFEKARKQLIFSLANTRYALEPIMEYNQMEAQKAGQSWAAFNQRMAQNQANFEAQQRAHVNKSEAINNAIMSGWRERNASSDRQQEQFVDAINERTKVQNAETGQQFKVESHHNQYWMNSDGEYIGTNLNDYNPNLDENMNNQKWQQLKQVDYK